MTDDVAIRAEGLGKAYRITRSRGAEYRTLRDDLVDLAGSLFRGRAASEQETVWALGGVSFEVKRGEALGVVGRNGAGKSTLLKILSRITEPTVGFAEVEGRVGSLLEVGTGFHPELTGRENVFLNGAILGMRQHEIARRFEEIVSFAEVERFIDTPVKRYSSGMYMRLAFAVAAHLEPEVLVVDEVLAVGDAAFQSKCLGKMKDAARGGRTVLFVSHNIEAVQNLTDRALWLEGGQPRMIGPTDDVLQQYLRSTVEHVGRTDAERRRDGGDGSARINAVTVRNADAPDLDYVRVGDRARIDVDYECVEELRWPVFSIGLYDPRGLCLYNFNSEIAGWNPEVLPLTGRVSCVTEPITLTAGPGWLNVLIKRGGVVADYLPEACRFDVQPADYFGTGRTPGRDYCVNVLRNSWTLQS